MHTHTHSHTHVHTQTTHSYKIGWYKRRKSRYYTHTHTHTHHIFFANHLPLLPSSSPLAHTIVFRVAIVNLLEATISYIFILSEPKFLEPPHDVLTYQGLPVTIPCSLAKPSSPSPSPSPSPLSEYFTVWRKNGRPLYQSNDVTVTTNGSLVIERSKVSDSGEYDCVAVGEEGVLTATISMAILPRPGLPHPPLHHHHNYSMFGEWERLSTHEA